MAEMKLKAKQNGVDLSQEGLFELQCMIKANDIHHAACREFRHGQFLAFVSGASDLGLYYLKDSSSLPVIKKIPWFQSSRKKIACLCFDPLGSWLLIATIDGSLYIVPAKTLVDEFYPTEQKWTTKDVTSYSSLNAQNSYSRPSAIVWWQGISFSGQMGIVGTEQGEIIFVNLETGQQVGSTKTDGKITGLCICQDTELDTVMLLITNHCKEQWHLVLEKPGSNYTYPLNNGGSQRSTMPTEEADNDDSKSFPTTRSRLRGLKQLSVEKLVILKQKLAETRNRNFDSSGARQDNSNRDSNSEAGSNDNENSNESGFFPNQQSDSIKCSTTPIALSNDAYIIPQWLKNGRTIYTRYLSSLNHLTVHERSSSAIPSHVHKMPEHCENIRLTSRFFYISDTRHRFVYVLSRPLSEIRKKDKSDLTKDSVIARFSFDKSEEVINSIYTLSSARSDFDYTSGNNENRIYTIVKDISDIKVKVPPVDTCIVVTNLGVYKIILREQILSLFMDLILKRRSVEDATKLGLIFGLNVQELIENAGDMTLYKRQFGRAMELYSLAGIRLSKSILKFATIGYTSELLSLLASYSTTSAVNELSEPNRIHFSNLSVLAFTELSLRATSAQNKVVYKDFLNFLSTNTFYDELYAINIAIQNNMWSILHHLIVHRGLGPQVLDVLIKALPTLMSKNSNLVQYHNTHGLLMCLSDSSLIQGMLNNPSTARNHICFVLANLSSLEIFILQRLIALYDPTNPAIRPLVLRFKARRRAASRSSFSSQCDSLDLSEDLDEIGVLIEEIIEIFLQTLLAVLHKKQPSVKFISKYVPFTQLNNIEGGQRERNVSVDFKRRLLSTGFAHTALIRNGNVYTWGNSLQGCLGTGPTISRYSSPQGITIFRRLGIDVLSISCGRCHTLAVTNNGVYVWGGNKYGQLGLGEVRECPNPELITALAQEIIVEAVAGQHHSAAITADGRLFTWGWGVHGQLGHGNTEAKRQPCLVTALLGVVVRHVSAGYAHTVALSADGLVYAFGCNLFGQLGVGNDGKCTSPMRVSLLPERITLISTKYFHNLATSCTNRLYIWGSNPQVLRLQSKERKVRMHKAKVAEAQERELAAASLADTPEEQENANDAGESSEAGAAAMVSNDTPQAAAKSSIVVVPEAENDEESQAHLVPACVDTSLVKGKIVQISTGYHHSALLTKDGTIYTWGRNLDGQLGTGYGRDVAIPTPLSYQPLDMFKEKLERARYKKAQATDDKNNANNGSETNADINAAEFNATEKDPSYLIKAVKICCGSNFTVAIQPGGNVLAWGNNNFAQLGRAPANPKESEEKLIFKFKSSKRIIRCINPSDRFMAIDMTPSQVSNIPAPIISYQSYDVTPLAGSIQPLSYIEHSLSDLTLHYAFEQFHGLFSTFKILNKCIELKNYQACAKLELLEHNFVESLVYQFKALKECDPANMETFSNGLSTESLAEDAKGNDVLQENNKLFEKHMERNLVDTLMESVKRQKMKMPVSKSLDSFQVIEQELHTFDCQGGSEEMFEDSKYEGMSIEMALEDDNKEDRSSPLSSAENSISREEADNENSLCTNYNKMSLNNSMEARSQCANGNALSRQELLVMRHAVNIVDFYLYEVEEDAYVPTYEIAATAINFWVENKFAIEELEKVFDKYIKKVFYALGLLLFGRCDSQSSSTIEKNEKNIRVKNASKILSTSFCLKVCNLILEQIDEGKPTVEYIEMLSTTMAKNYGPPLTGYPGTSDNKTPEQMMDGIISTLSAKYYDPRPFIHIKDPDKVSELLSAEEDSMIFTCGHQFLISTYQSEAVPRMEAELLALQPPLPSTVQLLGSILYQSYKPETLCPLCLSQVLKDAGKDVADR
ncbi:uncharacterized protein LOC100677930 isoform X2 [Nasonia vitripennis]|uniref:RCC1-like domain-containing protein n=1 Tax=Nasonia vitripennis TaxID=7425 RepID=A0A7M7PYJ0_NASVI|nr:uncharacterized protein LOC100677930 isoform X2 [Nasonia vitripennis]XP_032451699.1 uncharacterized protein LOC100677930 isoform X2 [Nasonia vitripennis]